MKYLLKTFIIASLVITPFFALAQNESWYLSGSLLRPLVNTWNVYAPADLRFDGDLLPDGADCLAGQILKKVGANDWDCATDASGSDPFTHPSVGVSATTSEIRSSTASSSALRVSISTTFEYLGTGLAKITNGALSLATAGLDYLVSYDAWTHPYSGASATTSDIIITGKVGIGTSTPLRDLDVLGTLSFDLFSSPFRKAEWNNLAYGESELLSGGTISFSGAADNWSVASTTAKVNGRFWSSDSVNGLVATSTFMINGKSIKDPSTPIKEGSTYYIFYTVVSNSLGITDADIGYATSPDLRNWTDQGVLINHTNWWGGATLPTWAPSVIKVGSTYYMFVTTLDGGTFKMGYATSATLTGTYTFIDYVKDSGANVINYLDAHVIYYNGTYYMVAGNGNIKLWSTSSLAGNSWTDRGQLLSITKNWETTDGVFEAPYLVPGTPTLLFYGASGSHDDQRIGLAVANDITGPYTKMGVDGQVLLDSPSEAVGPIDHPAIYYDKESSRWYLFASHGTTAGGHLYQRLAGYWSSDLSNWQSIATSTQLKPSVTNYVYINPAGQLMAAADLPYDSGRDGTFPERQGYLRLGSLTVNSSRQVTASSAYQGKKTMMDWLGIGTTTPGTPLAVNGAGVFTGNVLAPSFIATSTVTASTFPYASTTALSVSGSGSAFVVSTGKVGIGISTPTTTLDVIKSSSIAKARIAQNNTDTAITNTLLTGNYLQLGGQEYNTSNNTPSLRVIGFGYNNALVNNYSPAYIGYKETSNAGSTNGDLGFYTRNSTTGTVAPTERLTITAAGNVGIGTTTPQWLLNPTSNSAAQLSLSAGAGIAQWVMRNAGGNLLFATTTVAGNATTSTSALTLFGSGVPSLQIGSSTPQNTLKNGSLVLGGGGDSGGVTGSTTIQMAKIQIDGQNSAGARVCVFVQGTTLVASSGACTP